MTRLPGESRAPGPPLFKALPLNRIGDRRPPPRPCRDGRLGPDCISTSPSAFARIALGGPPRLGAGWSGLPRVAGLKPCAPMILDRAATPGEFRPEGINACSRAAMRGVSRGPAHSGSMIALARAGVRVGGPGALEEHPDHAAGEDASLCFASRSSQNDLTPGTDRGGRHPKDVRAATRAGRAESRKRHRPHCAVSDLARSTAFYRDQLGGRIAASPPTPRSSTLAVSGWRSLGVAR